MQKAKRESFLQGARLGRPSGGAGGCMRAAGRSRGLAAPACRAAGAVERERCEAGFDRYKPGETWGPASSLQMLVLASAFEEDLSVVPPG